MGVQADFKIAPSVAHMGPRVVAIDDDPLFTMLLEDLVTNAGGAWLGGPGSLNEAAGALANAPDVVFLDLHLPDGGGVDAVRRIKQFTIGHVVVLTGTETIDDTALMAAGATAVIAKQDEDLEAIIDCLIRPLVPPRAKGKAARVKAARAKAAGEKAARAKVAGAEAAARQATHAEAHI